MMARIRTEMHSKANCPYCLTKKMAWKKITCVWIHLVRFGASLMIEMFFSIYVFNSEKST